MRHRADRAIRRLIRRIPVIDRGAHLEMNVSAALWRRLVWLVDLREGAR